MPNLIQRLFGISPENVHVTTEENYIKNIQPNMLNPNQFNDKDAPSISSVYTCIKVLGDTLSRLPLNVYQETAGVGKTIEKEDYRYPLLHYQPNYFTTSQTFISTLEWHRNLKGNAFAKIIRNPDTARVEMLQIIPPSIVTGYNIVDNKLYYQLEYEDERDKPIKEVVIADDMLHFKMISSNGIMGVNPIEALRKNLSVNWKGLTTIDTFYTNNAVTPKALKSMIPDAAYRPRVKEGIEDFMSNYAGPTNAGQMIVLPEYTEVQDLTMSLVDAEFLETIKFNTNQISALYGVPYHMVGELTASKWSNVQQMALDFKLTTLDNIARMYRQEFESKLLSMEERLGGKSIEFNFMAYLESSPDERIKSYKDLFSVGAIEPNEIRIREGYPVYPEGSKKYVPSNFQPTDKKEPE